MMDAVEKFIVPELQLILKPGGESWEINCNRCGGIFGIIPNCPRCRGTGKRAVELLGGVVTKAQVMVVLSHNKTNEPFVAYWLIDDWYTIEEFGAELIVAHQAKTLPKSLYRSEENPYGLHESEITR